MTIDHLIAELIKVASSDGNQLTVYVGVKQAGSRWVDRPAVRVYVDRGRVFIDAEEAQGR